MALLSGQVTHISQSAPGAGAIGQERPWRHVYSKHTAGTEFSNFSGLMGNHQSLIVLPSGPIRGKVGEIHHQEPACLLKSLLNDSTVFVI